MECGFPPTPGLHCKLEFSQLFVFQVPSFFFSDVKNRPILWCHALMRKVSFRRIWYA